MPRDPVKNRANTARTRMRQKEAQELKKQIMARWAEHNKFHIARQEDGGFRIGLEQTPVEGERITAELAELCGMDPDTFVQTILGEVLTAEGGVWKPISEDRQEIARLRAENAELMRRAGM